jgi:hypothetical protein
VVASVLAYAAVWPIVKASPAGAQQNEPGAAIRVIKGGEWTEQARPPGAGPGELSQIFMLKGANWHGGTAQPNMRIAEKDLHQTSHQEVPAQAPGRLSMEEASQGHSGNGPGREPTRALHQAVHQVPLGAGNSDRNGVSADVVASQGTVQKVVRIERDPQTPPLSLPTTIASKATPLADRNPSAGRLTDPGQTVAKAEGESRGTASRPMAASAPSQPVQGAAAGLVEPMQVLPRRDWVATNLFYKITFLQLTSNVIALLLGPVMVLVAIRSLVRRYGSQLESLLRVGLVAVTPTAEPAPRLQMPSPIEEWSTDDPRIAWTLGPTYAEEMQLREEAERNQQEAMVRQIFEDNVRLNQELAALETADVQ